MQFRQQLLPTQPTNVWTSGCAVVGISNLSQGSIFDWKVDQQVHVNIIIGNQDERSDFEKSVAELFSKGLVTLDYVQDVFKQEQIFRDNFERIQMDYPNKYIVVCGGEIFDGETLKDAETKAYEKYRNRPTYSYSPTVEL
jgi:hypothetical protein